jgi:hypothetical protein
MPTDAHKAAESPTRIGVARQASVGFIDDLVSVPLEQS